MYDIRNFTFGYILHIKVLVLEFVVGKRFEKSFYFDWVSFLSKGISSVQKDKIVSNVILDISRQISEDLYINIHLFFSQNVFNYILTRVFEPKIPPLLKFVIFIMENFISFFSFPLQNRLGPTRSFLVEMLRRHFFTTWLGLMIGFFFFFILLSSPGKIFSFKNFGNGFCK